MESLHWAQQWTLAEEHHGRRVDAVLSQLVPQSSRSHLQALIEEAAVSLDGFRVTKASTKVTAGQQLRLEFRPSFQHLTFGPERMDLDVVYQDEHILVINKPVGLVVHPAAGNWSGTLLNGLLGLDPVHASLPRAGIVHRLDKDTSGLMVVARTRPAMDQLVKMIGDRQVHREYLALAHGVWRRPPQFRCEGAIGRDARNRLRMAVVDLDRQQGKPAVTHFSLLAQSDRHCLVRAQLETGRTHQIRVHMSHLGHPLVGDGLYGGKNELDLTRQALHARVLRFEHPIHGHACAFEAPLAQDIVRAFAALGWDTMQHTSVSDTHRS